MRLAVSAIFISGAVGGDSMTQYAADTWAVVYARERHTSSICGGRSGTATAMARHHHLCRTTPGPRWGFPRYPALGCAVARRIPRLYNLYKFKHFLKYINFLMYAI